MSAFYSENNPKAAAWLRELIKEGHIAPGIVDERSIKEIKPHELTKFTQCHFFAGIGGWSLSLRFAGWPDDKPVWTGSCPCQPFSIAGLRRGESDDRHLWPIFCDLIAQSKISDVFGEQVASPDGRLWLARVRAEMEALGYVFGASDLCAAGISAPHIRQRLYWVGFSNGQGWKQGHSASEIARHGDSSVPTSRPDSSGLYDSERIRRTTRGNNNGQDVRNITRPTSELNNGCRLADSDGPRCGELRRSEPTSSEHPATERISPSLGLADCNNYHGQWWSGPLQVGRNAIEGEIKRGRRKYRAVWRIEPGLSLLADGIPGRVAQISGFGNAIVPQLAAEFIQASIEALAETQNQNENNTSH